VVFRPSSRAHPGSTDGNDEAHRRVSAEAQARPLDARAGRRRRSRRARRTRCGRRPPGSRATCRRARPGADLHGPAAHGLRHAARSRPRISGRAAEQPSASPAGAGKRHVLRRVLARRRRWSRARRPGTPPSRCRTTASRRSGWRPARARCRRRTSSS
jgi:hypothetical protein